MKSTLRKMLFVDLIKGLKVTFRYQDPKEAITEQYPLQRPQIAERFRGAPRLNNNPDTNETLCISCGLCEDACPVDALELTQDFEMANYSREGLIWDRETLEKGPEPNAYRR